MNRFDGVIMNQCINLDSKFVFEIQLRSINLTNIWTYIAACYRCYVMLIIAMIDIRVTHWTYLELYVTWGGPNRTFLTRTENVYSFGRAGRASTLHCDTIPIYTFELGRIICVTCRYITVLYDFFLLVINCNWISVMVYTIIFWCIFHISILYINNYTKLKKQVPSFSIEQKCRW